METYFDEKQNDYIHYVSNIVKLEKIQTTEDYKLIITFSTGEQKIFNVFPLLEKNIFKPLRNKTIFNTAHIEYNAIVWNEVIELAADFLYKESEVI